MDRRPNSHQTRTNCESQCLSTNRQPKPTNCETKCVETNCRESILRDPNFESARQTLERSLTDFNRMSNSLGLPIMAGPECMQQMVSTLGTQEEYRSPCLISRNLNTLRMRNNSDDMNFLPDCFQIIVDVKGFLPNEISVTIEGNVVEISAQHHDASKNSVADSEMHKRFLLPQNVQANALQSNVSSDGVLVLSAPWRTE